MRSTLANLILYPLSFFLLVSLVGRILSEGRTSSNAWCTHGCEDVSTDMTLGVRYHNLINWSTRLISKYFYLRYLRHYVPLFTTIHYRHLRQHPEVQKVIAKIEEVTYVPRANYESLQVRVLETDFIMQISLYRFHDMNFISWYGYSDFNTLVI